MPETRRIPPLVYRHSRLDLKNPGEWCIGRAEEPGRFVVLVCFCGHQIGARDHRILKQEPLTLEPSLVCPEEGCGAHFYVRNGAIEAT